MSKKIISIILAVVMLLSLTATAMVEKGSSQSPDQRPHRERADISIDGGNVFNKAVLYVLDDPIEACHCDPCEVKAGIHPYTSSVTEETALQYLQQLTLGDRFAGTFVFYHIVDNVYMIQQLNAKREDEETFIYENRGFLTTKGYSVIAENNYDTLGKVADCLKDCYDLQAKGAPRENFFACCKDYVKEAFLWELTPRGFRWIDPDQISQSIETEKKQKEVYLRARIYTSAKNAPTAQSLYLNVNYRGDLYVSPKRADVSLKCIVNDGAHNWKYLSSFGKIILRRCATCGKFCFDVYNRNVEEVKSLYLTTAERELKEKERQREIAEEFKKRIEEKELLLEQEELVEIREATIDRASITGADTVYPDTVTNPVAYAQADTMHPWIA